MIGGRGLFTVASLVEDHWVSFCCRKKDQKEGQIVDSWDSLGGSVIRLVRMYAAQGPVSSKKTLLEVHSRFQNILI